MTGKVVSKRDFQEACLSLIDEVGRTHEAVTIIDLGRPVARLVPSDEGVGAPNVKKGKSPVIGGLRGSVLRYDDPFAPASDASDWEALR